MYFTWYQRGRRWSGRPHDVEICYRALGWEDRAPPIDLKSPGKVQAQVWEFEREGEHLTVTAWQQRPGSSLGSVPFQQTFRQDIFAGYFEFPREGAPSRSELETAAQAAVKEVESLLQPAQ